MGAVAGIRVVKIKLSPFLVKINLSPFLWRCDYSPYFVAGREKPKELKKDGFWFIWEINISIFPYLSLSLLFYLLIARVWLIKFFIELHV